MEQLRLQADQFRSQGRLKDKQMVTIIEKLNRDTEAKGGGGQDEEAIRFR
jgi:hypothetical protein